MLELMQNGLYNNFLAKLGPFDSNFTFQGLGLSFLVKLNVTAFGKFYKELAWKFIIIIIIIFYSSIFWRVL